MVEAKHYDQAVDSLLSNKPEALRILVRGALNAEGTDGWTLSSRRNIDADWRVEAIITIADGHGVSATMREGEFREMFVLGFGNGRLIGLKRALSRRIHELAEVIAQDGAEYEEYRRMKEKYEKVGGAEAPPAVESLTPA